MRIVFRLTILLSLVAFDLSAQEPTFEVPVTSPPAMVKQRVAATDIEINYNRPSMRDREIFGALIPYDQVWRTGADAATRIAFSTPVSFGGSPVPAGSYELFTIPGMSEWTVIVAKDRSQWGSYKYDPEGDVARVTLKPTMLSERVETLTLSLDELTANSTVLRIAWDKVRVPVKIEVDVRATVLPQLEAALQAEGDRPYFRAAMFYFDNDLDIDRAAELIALALEKKPDHIGMLYRQALILERKGDVQGAIAAAERSLASASATGQELKEEYTRLNNALLARLKHR